MHAGPAGHGHRVRAAADALEEVVADYWLPLPTYQEMLFESRWIFVRGRGVRAASDPACRAVGALQAGHGSTGAGKI